MMQKKTMLLCDWDYILPAVEKEALGYRLGEQPVSVDVSLGIVQSRTKRKGPLMHRMMAKIDARYRMEFSQWMKVIQLTKKAVDIYG